MDSTALGEEDAFLVWLVMHPQADEYSVDIMRDAFLAGYSLARSQSTQGTGDWEPK